MTTTDTPADTVTCPACDGSGEVTDPRDNWRHSSDPDVRMLRCYTCQGDERITPAEARAWMRRNGWSTEAILEALQ